MKRPLIYCRTDNLGTEIDKEPRQKLGLRILRIEALPRIYSSSLICLPIHHAQTRYSLFTGSPNTNISATTPHTSNRYALSIINIWQFLK